MTSASDVDALLPQTQCGQCGYKFCLKYAEAIINGEDINRCPMGGDKGIEQLDQLLNRPFLPLNEECGSPRPFEVADIEIPLCIGCTLCIAVCPTDAIIGTKKHLHEVDPELCSGCGLCVEACPVDCVSMVKAGQERTRELSSKFKLLFLRKNKRLANRIAKQEKKLAKQSSTSAKKAFLSSLRKELK